MRGISNSVECYSKALLYHLTRKFHEENEDIIALVADLTKEMREVISLA